MRGGNGQGLHGAFGWNAQLVAVVTAVLAAALAVFGYDWVHRVFRFLLIISLPCYAIISVAILAGHAGGHTPAHPGGFVFAAFMSQFSVAAAYNITYAPYVSDYSRYMPRRTPARGIIAAVFFGASGSAVWLIALGAWLASRLNISDGLVGLQISGDNVAAPLGSITAFPVRRAGPGGRVAVRRLVPPGPHGGAMASAVPAAGWAAHRGRAARCSWRPVLPVLA